MILGGVERLKQPTLPPYMRLCLFHSLNAKPDSHSLIKADGFGQPSLAPIAGDEVTAVQVLGRGDVQNIHRARTQLRGISFRQ